MEIVNFRDFDSRFNNESLNVINEELKFIKEKKKINLKCLSKEATVSLLPKTGWKSLYNIKYYIASVWRAQLDQKRKCAERYKTK